MAISPGGELVSSTQLAVGPGGDAAATWIDNAKSRFDQGKVQASFGP